MNPTTPSIRVTLKNTTLTLVFDLNTFAAFEEATGKMFLTWMDDIQRATMQAQTLRLKKLQEAQQSLEESLEDGSESEAVKRANLEASAEASASLLRSVSMRDFRALVWAANHTYDRAGQPRWALSLMQIGNLIDLSNFAKVMPEVLRGGLNSLPTPKPGEVKEETSETPFAHPSISRVGGNGGTTSQESDAEILNLLTPNLGD